MKAIAMLAMLGATAALGGCLTRSDTGGSSVKVIHGVPTNEFPAVVQLSFRTDRVEGICTGTFISDRAVLTAAHCVPVGEPGLVVTVESKGEKVIATELIRHPNFRSAPPGQPPKALDARYDVAIVRFPPGSAESTLPVSQGATVAVGTELTIIGYGADSPQNDFATAGVKRMGKNSVKLAQDGVFAMSDMLRRVVTNAGAGQIVATAKGDSGGPALDAEGRVVGVSSMGVNAEGATFFFYCDVAGDEVRSFIAEQARRGAGGSP